MPTEAENLQAILNLLEFHFSYIGLAQGFGLGITVSGGYLIVGFVRSIMKDDDTV